jgi:hypothetical protein
MLRAGILEDGVVTIVVRTGAVSSPLVANVYLHDVFDLWAERRPRREAADDMIMVGYADDIIVGFERESDARHSGTRCAVGCRSSHSRFIRTKAA